MAIPVLALPDQGQILARPRFEPVYDTEGYDDGANVASLLTIFKNSAAFANTSLGLTKQKYRDVNLDQTSGMSVGQSFQAYAMSIWCRPMNTNLLPVDVAIFDQIRRIRENTWTTLFLQQRTPYITVQTWQIPARVDVMPYTTQNARTLVGPAQYQSRENCYDVTFADQPLEFGQLEAWTMEVAQSGLTLTPNVDLYVRGELIGIFLRGMQ